MVDQLILAQQIGNIHCLVYYIRRIIHKLKCRIGDLHFPGPLCLEAAYQDMCSLCQLCGILLGAGHIIDEVCTVFICCINRDLVFPPGLGSLYIYIYLYRIINRCCHIVCMTHHVPCCLSLRRFSCFGGFCLSLRRLCFCFRRCCFFSRLCSFCCNRCRLPCRCLGSTGNHCYRHTCCQYHKHSLFHSSFLPLKGSPTLPKELLYRFFMIYLLIFCAIYTYFLFFLIAIYTKIQHQAIARPPSSSFDSFGSGPSSRFPSVPECWSRW